MSLVAYGIECNFCNSAIERQSIYWVDEQQLYIGSRLISSDEMEDLLQIYYKHDGYCCIFCGGNGNFSFFEIDIDGQDLFSTKAKFFFSNNIQEVNYQLIDIVKIISSVADNYDLTLKKYCSNLDCGVEHSYKISYNIITNLLSQYYSGSLLHIESENLLIDYINYFLQTNITFSDYDIYGDYMNYYLVDLKDYPDSNNVLLFFFGNNILQLPLNKTNAYFCSEYKKTYKFIVQKLNQIFIPQGVQVDNYMAKSVNETLSLLSRQKYYFIKSVYYRILKLFKT